MPEEHREPPECETCGGSGVVGDPIYGQTHDAALHWCPACDGTGQRPALEAHDIGDELRDELRESRL